jgi:molybdopterin molybdotransferase
MREGSWDQAREIASTAFPRLSNQQLSLSDSVGRLLALDAHALCDLPAYETSSMDGWAISGAGPWKIIGEVATGKKSSLTLTDGACAAIATGGVIPEGTTAVIPWENATESAGTISGSVEAGANLRPAGMECKKGDLLVTAGTSLTPPMVGLLAAVGHDHIEVISKPRVAIFFLGDELLHEGIPLDGAIRDALGPQLPAILASAGAEVISAQFVRDDLDTLNMEIASKLDSVDIVITTGGTADGPRDYVKPAITHLQGEMLIDCARVRPGYHVLLAKFKVGNHVKAFLALPGNPQSALAAFASFGAPLISSYLGIEDRALAEIKLDTKIKTPEGFSRLVPGNLNGEIFLQAEYLGSAMLRGVAHSNGFALVAPGNNEAGAIARWLPFNY